MACVEVLHKKIVVLIIDALFLGDEMLDVEAAMLINIISRCFGVNIVASSACVHILR
jgi:hypothetical protein